MNTQCSDNRFEAIERAKKDLLDSTNINTSPEEMNVLDSFLFRCWQMEWLDRYEADINFNKHELIRSFMFKNKHYYEDQFVDIQFKKEKYPEIIADSDPAYDYATLTCRIHDIFRDGIEVDISANYHSDRIFIDYRDIVDIYPIERKDK